LDSAFNTLWLREEEEELTVVTREAVAVVAA
jgi:hypothetical protein